MGHESLTIGMTTTEKYDVLIGYVVLLGVNVLVEYLVILKWIKTLSAFTKEIELEMTNNTNNTTTSVTTRMTMTSKHLTEALNTTISKYRYSST